MARDSPLLYTDDMDSILSSPSCIDVVSQPRCPASLSGEQILQFRSTGYLAFSDVISSEDRSTATNALRRVTQEMLSDSTTQYSPSNSGSGAWTQGNYSGATYGRAESRSRMQLEPGIDPSGKSTEEIELLVRKYVNFIAEDAVFERIVSPGSNLYSIVEGILGKNPILFQNIALVKPPFVGTEKPWHQDNAYFSVLPLDGILGVWVALDDAGPENGCMHVLSGGHKEGAFRHHHGIDCEIDPALLPTENAVPVPVPAGGAMFFHGMLPHETPPNRSSQRRRALQFHFRGADTRIVNDEAYDKIFVNRAGEASTCRAASDRGF